MSMHTKLIPLILCVVGALASECAWANRYYSPETGRFISRDPIGYEDSLNLYEYVGSKPTLATDPEGTDQKKIEKKFTDWYKKEKKAGLGWLKGLPDCPCKVTINTYSPWYTCGFGSSTECVNPNAAVWTEPTEWLWGFHKGAKCCIRSKVPNASNAGQQCCYDKDGKLITHGEGAGTPDKVSPEHNNWWEGGHQDEDVIPASMAYAIDGYQFGKFSKMYNQVRPPNKGKNCPKNP